MTQITAIPPPDEAESFDREMTEAKFEQAATAEQWRQHNEARDRRSRDPSTVAVVQALSNWANGARKADFVLFADLLMREHRTIQQRIATAFLHTFSRWATSPFDLRNEATVKAAKEIAKVVPYPELPYV